MTPDFAQRQRVLVIHSEPILAIGLRAVLEHVPEFDVRVGESPAAHGEGGAARRVILCDYAASVRFVDEMRDAGIVLLAKRAREFEIEEALERGVLGYVVIGCGLDELKWAVQAAARGRRFLCRATAREVANRLIGESLTVRERDVLELLARGSCNKAIASQLDIAVGTVKAHVRAIMSKLKVTSRTQAASTAMERGLLPEPQPANDSRTPMFCPDMPVRRVEHRSLQAEAVPQH